MSFLGRLFVVSSLLSASVWAGKLIAPGPEDVLTPDEVVIRLKPNGVISTVLAGFNNTVSVAASQSSFNLYLLKVPAPVRDVILQQLAALNEVEYAEPNRIRTASGITPNDTSYATQWWLTKMQASSAWSLYPAKFPNAGEFGSRVRVAILDTGANCTHPDFINSGGSTTDLGGGGQFNWALSQALVATTAVGAVCPWQDDHGHGTHVSGTVASATNNATGVASLGFPAELVIFKVLNSQGNGNDFTIAQAITAATDAGARVISMSLGGSGYSQVLQDAVNYAWNHDALVVAASGNGNTSGLTYPGGANYAMGIGATDSSDLRASFSNYGFGLDVMAPGVNIYSTYLNSTYATLSGTSMATPNVAALASLLFATTPNLSADAVMQRIEMSADTTTLNGLWDLYMGFGRVNAFSALNGTLPVKSGGGLVGQIVDAAGNSIASAAVGMGGLNGNTDANGLFRFANVPPGTYTFTTSGGGFPARSQTVVIPAGADTHVRLELGVSTGVFSGTIREGSTALRNVVVQALSGGLVRQATVTDANGLYTLTVIAGTYDLRISAVGRSTQTAAGVAVAGGGVTTTDFDMTALGSISGVVTDNTPGPVSGAQVTAYNAADSGGASSAANGGYNTISLPAGTYTVVVSAPNHLPTTINNVVVSDGVATNLDVQLTLSGVVTALTLSPVTVGGGASATGNIVTLSMPAGTGGAVVSLSSNKPLVASLPATVTVPQGATQSSPFTITTTAVTSNTVVAITATLGGVSKSANLTVLPYLMSGVYLSPAVTGGGATTTANRVQLNAPTPAGGAVVSLTSDTPGVTVPATVTIPAGVSLSGFFNITTSAVAAPTTVVVTATYGTSSRTATLTVNPTSLSTFTVSPLSVAGGKPLTSAVVKLDSPAPAGGAVVQLTSSDPSVQVPATVTIPAGATTSANITITTSVVNAATQVILTATYAGVSKAATITLTPLAISGFTLPASIAGGKPITTALLSITAPAPAGGLAISLSSSDPAVAPPATVTVPAGTTSSGFFTIPTTSVSTATSVIVTATLGGVAKTATVLVKPPALLTFTASPATVSGGKTITSASVTLDGPAGPSGAVIVLSSSDPSVTPPATVTVPSGATTSGNFTMTTSNVSVSTPVTVTATFAGATKTVSLTVKPPALISFVANPLTVIGGKPVTSASVTLDGPAGPSGALVTLVSSDPSVTPPATITVPAGATTSASFAMPTTSVSTATAVTVTASYAGISKAVALTVKPPALLTFSASPLMIAGGKPITSARLTLDGPAGASGAVVSLTSTDPAVVPPATVTVPAGATSSGFFTINTLSVAAITPATVTASYAGVSKQVSITVKPPALATFSVSPLLISGGKTITAASFTLDGPAGPSGASVVLTSSDPSVTPPATVNLAAGATASGNFSIPTSSVAANTPVTLTASFGGVSKSVVVTVKPTTLASFSMSAVPISGGKVISPVSLTLDGPAPAGGANVTLVSSGAEATPPAVVTIPAGATSSAYFSIPTSFVASATAVTITATYGGVSKAVTVTIKPTDLSSLSVSPTSVKGGAKFYLIAGLDGPAIAGGVTISISSPNPAVPLPPALTVSGGATSAMLSVTTSAVAVSTPVTLTATYGAVTKTVNITLTP
ncbi:S8 family serine peptidase [Paludibaculum fermentans]|uniref:S8 family serine peptidase n=1 Tax=Paludibaculum fermentans TaxID=1473598 RepID=UPI003EBA512E